MNKYKAFYHSKTMEVHEDTSYKAQRKAASLFKARRPSEVWVMLLEKDNTPVTHHTNEI